MALACLLGGAASAQDLPFGDGQPVTVVDELVAKGPGGPAWWQVSDGDTTVFILATPGGGIPKDVTWETRLLEVRIKEANALILPPTLSFGLLGIFSVPSLAFNLYGMQREGEKMERKLEPALRTRWVSAREKAGFPEERYGAHPPGMAAMLLLGDVYAKQFPRDPQTPRDTYGPRVEQVAQNIARDQHVRVDRAATYGLSLMNRVLDDLKVPGSDCMVSVLDDLDKGLTKDPTLPPDGGAAARAWAQGDVRPLLERAAIPRPADKGSLGTIGIAFGSDNVHLYRTNPVCAAPMDDFRRLVASFMTDEVNAIDEAMKKPGHAVAIVGAADLLRKGGVLEQLQAKGYEITLPNAQKLLANPPQPASAAAPS